jgi:hypothetical protein
LVFGLLDSFAIGIAARIVSAIEPTHEKAHGKHHQKGDESCSKVNARDV